MLNTWKKPAEKQAFFSYKSCEQIQTCSQTDF